MENEFDFRGIARILSYQSSVRRSKAIVRIKEYAVDSGLNPNAIVTGVQSALEKICTENE